MNDLFVGIEIGATKQQIALGDTTGNLLCVESEHICIPNGAKDILDWLQFSVPKIISKEKDFQGNVCAIGVGFGGIVESASGRVMLSVQVQGWNNVALKDWCEKQFCLPTIIVNDTVAGGYGELITGSGKSAQHFFYTNIGSGIGGAIFLSREAFDGQGLGAGYLGHTYVPDCFAHKPGGKCKVEDMCSGFAIERRLKRQGYVPRGSMLMDLCKGNVSKLSCRELGVAAQRKDRFALAEIDLIARSFGIALSNLITLLALDIVSVGGGVGNLGEILLKPIREYTNDFVFASSRNKFSIVQCKHMDNAVLVGAVLFAKGHTKELLER